MVPSRTATSRAGVGAPEAFGAAWSEPVLLACAFAFEQATSFRRKPQFRATL